MHAPSHPAIALDDPTDPEPSTARRPEPVERDWIDTAIEWASGLAAVAMFAYGVALSYSVLYAIAGAAGLPGWSRRLWPLGWELFMASAALNALAEQRHLRSQVGLRRVPWYPLSLTAATAGGSILLNWFHPAIPLDPPPGWLTSLVYGLPPLEAVLAWHLFLLRIAHRRHQARVSAGAGGPTHQPTAAGHRGPPPQPAQTPAVPAEGRDRPGPAGARDAGLLAQARAAAAEHDNTHGRPIGRDALRQALRVSNQTAGALLRELRADQADGAPVPAGERAEPGGGTAPAPVAGNGASGRPAGLAALVPTVAVPDPAEDGRGEAGDA
jgi:hypothetical protein